MCVALCVRPSCLANSLLCRIQFLTRARRMRDATVKKDLFEQHGCSTHKEELHGRVDLLIQSVQHMFWMLHVLLSSMPLHGYWPGCNGEHAAFNPHGTQDLVEVYMQYNSEPPVGSLEGLGEDDDGLVSSPNVTSRILGGVSCQEFYETAQDVRQRLPHVASSPSPLFSCDYSEGPRVAIIPGMAAAAADAGQEDLGKNDARHDLNIDWPKQEQDIFRHLFCEVQETISWATPQWIQSLKMRPDLLKGFPNPNNMEAIRLMSYCCLPGLFTECGPGHRPRASQGDVWK